VLAFNSLGEKELEAIVGKQLDKLKKKLGEDREVYLEVPPEALAYLAQESLDPAYGARPVGRTMQRIVLSPLASALLAGDIVAGDTLTMSYSEAEGLGFSTEQKGAAAD